MQREILKYINFRPIDDRCKGKFLKYINFRPIDVYI